MDQQIAHRDVGVTQIGAEQGLPEVVEELATAGMAAEELAALVPRAVEGGVALLNISLEAAKKGRQQGGLIFLCGTFQLFAIEILVAIVAGKYPGEAWQIIGG